MAHLSIWKGLLSYQNGLTGPTRNLWGKPAPRTFRIPTRGGHSGKRANQNGAMSIIILVTSRPENQDGYIYIYLRLPYLKPEIPTFYKPSFWVSIRQIFRVLRFFWFCSSFFVGPISFPPPTRRLLKSSPFPDCRFGFPPSVSGDTRGSC